MRYRNYKLCASIGRSQSLLLPVTTVLDTGAGPNLVNIRKLPMRWHPHIRQMPVPNLVDAQKRRMEILGVLPLIVRIRSSQGESLFYGRE